MKQVEERNKWKKGTSGKIDKWKKETSGKKKQVEKRNKWKKETSGKKIGEYLFNVYWPKKIAWS